VRAAVELSLASAARQVPPLQARPCRRRHQPLKRCALRPPSVCPCLASALDMLAGILSGKALFFYPPKQSKSAPDQGPARQPHDTLFLQDKLHSIARARTQGMATWHGPRGMARPRGMAHVA
jgi:hypothetical protein